MKQLINTSLPWGADSRVACRLRSARAMNKLGSESRSYPISFGGPYRSLCRGSYLASMRSRLLILFIYRKRQPERFGEIIRHAIPAELSASVFDRNGIVSARSERSDEFVGKPIRGVRISPISGPRGRSPSVGPRRHSVPFGPRPFRDDRLDLSSAYPKALFRRAQIVCEWNLSRRGPPFYWSR